MSSDGQVAAEAQTGEQARSTLSVFLHSSSDAGVRHLADRLAGDLSSAGFRSRLLNEDADPDQDHGLRIFVAPHEFFSTPFGRRWAKAEIIERSVLFNTQPVHAPEFKKALPQILAARGILDGSPQRVHLLRQSGLDAFLVRLGAPVATQWLAPADLDHPLVAALPSRTRRLDFDPSAWDERAIEVGFFDRYSKRRGDFFGRHASRLAARTTFIYMQQGGRDPLDEALERRAHFRIAGHVGGNAKITLRIVEDEFHDFDWHRCVHQTLASGSVIVSDHCPPHPLFKAGVHLFADDIRHIPDRIDWLLGDADGRRAALAMRANVFSALDDLARDPSRLGLLADFLSGASAPCPGVA